MKLDGQVAAWRYRQARSGYGGFHTSADATGALSLIEVLPHLSVGQEHTIPLAVITPEILSVPNNSRDHAVGYTRFVVRVVAGKSVQRFAHAHPVLILEASCDTLAEMANAYRGVAAGDGDFSIGPDEHNLWFWSWPRRG